MKSMSAVLERFRPFALPERSWLKDLGEALTRRDAALRQTGG